MTKRTVREAAFLLGACVIGCLATAPVSADDQQTVQSIANTFAQAALYEGKAVGVGVGVAYKNEVFYTAGFGSTDGGFAVVTPDTLFEIASSTKVLTTNLLGQAVYNGQLHLSDHLSQFPSLGTLKPRTGKVTLEELADFTGGFPRYARLCNNPPKRPGCVPSLDPTPAQYDAKDFLDYFQNFSGKKKLPARYSYSNFAIGLLGLLMAAPHDGSITNASLNDWFTQVDNQILKPLGMNHTYMLGAQPSSITPAKGFSLAVATAEVKNGQVSAIKIVKGGSGYSSATPPAVTIWGGCTTSNVPTAVATVAGGAVTGITVTNGGSGCIAPPDISFIGGSPSKHEHASAIAITGSGFSCGQLVAIDVTSAGAGYQNPPKVKISGGRVGGRNATAVAHIAHGNLVAVQVTDPGEGYGPCPPGPPPPLSVRIAPGRAESNVAPIWAAAGGLLSSTNDMTRFAAAAAGIPSVQSLPVPAAMAAGFTTAETPYACEAHNSSLTDCPFGNWQSGLAWAVKTADTVNDFPEVVTKNGNLPGFSSQIVVVPSRQLAVVVLINSDTTEPAGTIAFDIAHNLVLALP